VLDWYRITDTDHNGSYDRRSSYSPDVASLIYVRINHLNWKKSIWKNSQNLLIIPCMQLFLLFSRLRL